jgi:hypothetical protein
VPGPSTSPLEAKEAKPVPLESDDGKRPTLGLVVSLLDLGDGTCRLILDDVRSDQPRRETSWQFPSFYTHKRLDSRQLDAMSLPEAAYQDIGAAVVARLLAMNGQVK